jgi:hypothetical protein
MLSEAQQLGLIYQTFDPPGKTLGVGRIEAFTVLNEHFFG